MLQPVSPQPVSPQSFEAKRSTPLPPQLQKPSVNSANSAREVPSASLLADISEPVKEEVLVATDVARGWVILMNGEGNHRLSPELFNRVLQAVRRGLAAEGLPMSADLAILRTHDS